MQKYIGYPLEDVIAMLKSKDINFVVKDNNFNVQGDTKLVTNIQIMEDKTVVLTVGEFIFNLKGK